MISLSWDINPRDYRVGRHVLIVDNSLHAPGSMIDVVGKVGVIEDILKPGTPERREWEDSMREAIFNEYGVVDDPEALPAAEGEIANFLSLIRDQPVFMVAGSTLDDNEQLSDMFSGLVMPYVASDLDPTLEKRKVKRRNR